MGSGSPAPSSALLASTMRVNGLQASGVRSIMFMKPGYQLLGLARSRASNKSVTVRACIIARGRERVAQEPHGPLAPQPSACVQHEEDERAPGARRPRFSRRLAHHAGMPGRPRRLYVHVVPQHAREPAGHGLRAVV